MGDDVAHSFLYSFLSWGFCFISFAATALNIKKLPGSYFLWTMYNIYWLYVDAWQKTYPRVAVDVVNLIMSTYGLYVWMQKPKQKGN